MRRDDGGGDRLPAAPGRGGGRLAGALLLVALLALRLAGPSPLEALRLRVFDLWQSLHPRSPDEGLHPVLIVDVDEPSLRRLGQWPWARDRVAEMVDRIAAQGPAAIGFDLIFPEPDGRSPEQILDRYPGLAPAAREALAALPSNDALLAASLSRGRTVLGMAPVLTTTPDRRGPPFRHPPVRMAAGDLAAALPAFDAVVRSIDRLDAAAAGHASLVVTPEPDGIVRRLPAAIRVGDAVVPSLAVEMLRVGTGAGWFGLEGRAGAVTSVQAGAYRLPADADGRIWVNFSRHADWRFVPAWRVLEGDVPEGLFRGRLVLVGTTATGVSDLHATPVEPKIYGIEIQAQLLEAVLEGSVPSRPPWAGWAELAATAIAGLLTILLTTRLPVRWSFAPPAAATVVLAGGAWAAWTTGRLLLDPAFPALACGLVFTAALGGRLAATERARRAAEAALQAERDRALRLEGEMEAARDIQMEMLPRAFPAFPGRDDFDLHALIVPAKAIGGDLYDFFLLDEGRLFFLIGDVSGKGAPAALFMALTKATCKTAALRMGAAPGAAEPRHAGEEAMPARRISIGEVLREANEAIARESGGTMFVTLFAGILDLRNGELEWVNAGHEPPFVLDPAGPPRRLPAEGGPPLGAVEGFLYEAARARLEPGAGLLLFTDGVTEAAARSGERFGLARTAAALGEAGSLAPAQAIERLHAEVLRFARGAEQADDITILALRRSARPSP